MPTKKTNHTPEPDGQTHAFIFVNTDTGTESSELLRARKSQVSVRERRHSALRSVEAQRSKRQRALHQDPTSKPPERWAMPSSGLGGLRHQCSEGTAAGSSVENGADRQIDVDRQKALFQARRDLKRKGEGVPPTICFKDDAVDPFASWAVGIDRWTHNVVQYYVYKLTPDCFIAESRPSKPQPEQFNAAISARVRSVLSNELHMSSLMASCSSRMRRFESVNIENRRNSPEFFVAKAVTALRAQLAQNPTNIDIPTFLDIVSLCSAETYMGNWVAAGIHLELLKRLIRDMGGPTKLDSFLLELVSIIDVNLAIDADSVPSLPVDWVEWDTQSSPAQRMATVIEAAINETSLPTLEPGSLPGFDAGFFSVEIVTIVNETAVYLQAAQYIWNQPQSMPGDRKWIFGHGSHLLSRLLALKKGSAIPAPHPEIEECCRIALIIGLHAFLSHIRARQFMKVWAPRFKRALLRSYSTSYGTGGNRATVEVGRKVWLERPSIFLWVLNAGMYVAEGTDEEAWFVDEAARTATEVGVDARTAYSRYLETFFFVEDDEREELLQLVGRVEMRQRWSIVEQIVSSV